MMIEKKVTQVQEPAGSCCSGLGASVLLPFSFFFLPFFRLFTEFFQSGRDNNDRTNTIRPPATSLARSGKIFGWTQTRLKGTIRTIRCESKKKEKKPATILRWKTQMLEGRKRSICVNMCLFKIRANQSEKDSKSSPSFEKWKLINVQDQTDKNHLQKNPECVQGAVPHKEGFADLSGTFSLQHDGTGANNPCIVWKSSQQHLRLTASGINTLAKCCQEENVAFVVLFCFFTSG